MSQPEDIVRRVAAERVLAIGLGSSGTAVAIARALPEAGMLIALEPNRERALETRAAAGAAGVGAKIAVMIGSPARYLHKVSGPFDVIVVNLDHAEHEQIRPRLERLLRAGGTLVTP